MPAWAIAIAVSIVSIPFGWMVGLLFAFMLAGGTNWGQLPAATIPLGVVGAFIFAQLSYFRWQTRLAIMILGTVFLALLFQ